MTSFTGENSLGFVELNEFVFGANPRIDILHRVIVWQRAKRRAVSELVCCAFKSVIILNLQTSVKLTIQLNALVGGKGWEEVHQVH